MLEVLIVLNNYFNDISVSMVFVLAIVCSRFVRYGVRADYDDNESLELVRYALGKLNKIFIISVVCAILGGIIRYMVMEDFEMADAARNGQVLAIRVKYAMLIVLFTIGIIIRSLSSGRKVA